MLITSSTAVFELNSDMLTVSVPDSILDMSRISLTIPRRCIEAIFMSFTYSFCLLFSVPVNSLSSKSEKPIMEFSGVRSSCETCDKNFDLTSSDFLISEFIFCNASS